MLASFLMVLAHRWSPQIAGSLRHSPLHGALSFWFAYNIFLSFRVPELSIGQVHIIFCVPDVFCDLAPEPLMFVQWYTPLNAHDPLSGMYSVGILTSNHERSVSVISIITLVRSCHLIPHWEQAINQTWTRENVLDPATCMCFYVNPYTQLSDFILLCYVPRLNKR